MTDTSPFAQGDPREVNYYKVRKEIVALCITFILGWIVYLIQDWWRYMDWPPYDGSNKQFIKELNCISPNDIRTPTRAELKSWSIDVASTSSFMTRDYLLKKPQCAALMYFHFEGSGTRKTFEIIDVDKKTKTAKVVLTFESDDRSYK